MVEFGSECELVRFPIRLGLGPGLGFFYPGGWASQEIKYEVDDDAIDG